MTLLVPLSRDSVNDVVLLQEEPFETFMIRDITFSNEQDKDHSEFTEDPFIAYMHEKQLDPSNEVCSEGKYVVKA